MEDNTGPDLVELLRYVERLATETAGHERETAIHGRLSAVQAMAADVLARPLGKKRPATKTERQALIAGVQAYRHADSACRALDMHQEGEPPTVAALELAEGYTILAAYQAGYAQAMADQSDIRKHCARARSTSTKRAVQSVAEEIERAATAAGSAAGLAARLAPKVGRSIGYLERGIRDARKRLKSGCE